MQTAQSTLPVSSNARVGVDPGGIALRENASDVFNRSALLPEDGGSNQLSFLGSFVPSRKIFAGQILATFDGIRDCTPSWDVVDINAYYQVVQSTPYVTLLQRVWIREELPVAGSFEDRTYYSNSVVYFKFFRNFKVV